AGLLDGDQPHLRIAELGADAIGIGHGCSLQAFIASAVGLGRGPATTSVVGADKRVIAAAMVAATTTAASDFNMTAPCFRPRGSIRSRQGSNTEGGRLVQ